MFGMESTILKRCNVFATPHLHTQRWHLLLTILYCLAPEVCPRAAGPRTQSAPGYYYKFHLCTTTECCIHCDNDYKTLLVVCGSLGLITV